MSNSPTASPDLAAELPPEVHDVPHWLRDSLAVERNEGFIDSGGCPVHYFSWGDPAKPGLLLTHGFLAHARCFAFIAPFLAEDYYVVAFDHSGMGDSGTREDYSEQVRLQELMDVATGTGLFATGVAPTIIAHSFGGEVGLLAMEHHADRFTGLIICDLMTLRPERLMAMGTDRNAAASSAGARPNRVYPDYARARERFVLSPPQPVNEPSLMDYMAYHSLKQVDGGWTWKFDPGVFASTVDSYEHLLVQGKRIASAPGKIVIVYGKESALFDDDSAAYVRECGGAHIPMIGIPHARHHLMLDQPIAFASVLLGVLALLA